MSNKPPRRANTISKPNQKPAQRVQEQLHAHVVPTSECRYCSSEIHPNASRCPKCQAYLGWFGRISNWATGLNAISLFLTVSVLVFPIYQKVLAPQHAELRATVLKSEGKTFEYMVSNSGNRPATIIWADLRSKYLYNGKPIEETTRLDETFKTTVLEPEKIYRFASNVLSGIAPMQAIPGTEIDAPNIIKQAQTCYLDIIFVDFDSKQKKIVEPYPCFVPDLSSKKPH